MLTVFGFHTDDKLYTKHAQILAESAKKFNIHILLKQFSKDDWQTIIAFKPVFISQCVVKLMAHFYLLMLML
jgi:hypothetical protein